MSEVLTMKTTQYLDTLQLKRATIQLIKYFQLFCFKSSQLAVSILCDWMSGVVVRHAGQVVLPAAATCSVHYRVCYQTVGIPGSRLVRIKSWWCSVGGGVAGRPAGGNCNTAPSSHCKLHPTLPHCTARIHVTSQQFLRHQQTNQCLFSRTYLGWGYRWTDRTAGDHSYQHRKLWEYSLSDFCTYGCVLLVSIDTLYRIMSVKVMSHCEDDLSVIIR